MPPSTYEMVVAAKARSVVTVACPDGRTRTGRLICWPTDHSRSKRAAKILLASGKYISADPATVTLADQQP